MAEKIAELNITKPTFRWLFGGLGFHDSEATMTRMMRTEFYTQRVLKTYREISPTFSRVFGGYADWTREAMDAFADYYEASMKRSDATIYAVPGRMPLHETDDEMAAFAENIAERLDYLVNVRQVRHLRYFCATNELSVGNTYALLADNLERFRKYQLLLWRAFRKRGMHIGLAATDGSGFQNFRQIDWAAEHMDEITDVYCAHNYETLGEAFDSPAFYQKVYSEVSRVVQIALGKEKRFLLGEFGIHDESHFHSKVMRDDVFAGFGVPEKEAEAALMSVVQALAAINAGALGCVYWSFCDYPDPFLRDWGESPGARARYEAARFSGHGTDVRYNKNGLFRWNDEERDYSGRPFLYSIGLLAKYFKKDARLLQCGCEEEIIVSSAITNPDGSVSVCIVNLDGEERQARLTMDFPLAQEFRRYLYRVDAPPHNEFLDLQPYSDLLPCDKSGALLKLPAHSMTLLTSDYIRRTPPTVRGVYEKGGTLVWEPGDEETHCYYRVFRDGRQIASTVETSLPLSASSGVYTVRSVDRCGNVSDVDA